MRFRSKYFYTHKRMLDCMIRILRPVWTDEENVELKVEWFNKSGFYMGIRENILITKKEYSNWYEMEKV
jgi:hypothetical protein